MVNCHIVLPLLPYSFNPAVGVEPAESAPGGGRRQWRCACDPSVHVCVGDPSVYVSVLVTPQCMFLCQAGHGLAHPAAVAQSSGVSWAVQLLWAV